jgi:flavin reductase (DIM6/NTAB) family NADH-FMN oxidoreductase RutF
MKITRSPQPDWKPGIPVNSPVDEMVSIDAKDLDILGAYKMLIGTVVPRPIAFVTTVSANGAINAAPYSSWNLVTSKPATVVFSVAVKPNGEKKDTLRNIELTKEFVINTVGEWMVEAINLCSEDLPYGESEIEKVGLTPIPSRFVSVPRIKESPVHMECRLHSTLDIGSGAPGSATLVVGEVVAFHIHKPAYQDGKIVVEEIKPVSRLGGLRYGLVGDIFELPRPGAVGT